MNRREFLKSIVALPVIGIVLAKWPKASRGMITVDTSDPQLTITLPSVDPCPTTYKITTTGELRIEGDSGYKIQHKQYGYKVTLTQQECKDAADNRDIPKKMQQLGRATAEQTDKIWVQHIEKIES